MKRPRFTVADVLKVENKSLKNIATTSWQFRTLKAILRCRTSEMGSHIDKCTSCETLHISYNSCRNRHCSTCQGHKTKQWVDARVRELLPVSYFHVVFTIPHEFNPYCLKYPKDIYGALFNAAWATLKQFSKNPEHLGADIGMIGILHTWGQNMSLHPHLHCIIPGGGITKQGKWKQAKNKGKYLFNVQIMSPVFKAKFVAELRQRKLNIPQTTYDKVFKKDWVVYAKPAFGTAKSIVEYLGRYTHKIAISNHRILSVNEDTKKVVFSLKDYRKSGKKITLTLTTQEFVRRFSLHILPKGFTRLRHYGFLSSAWKKEKLPRLQAQMGVVQQIVEKKISKTVLKKCPKCKVGNLVTIVISDNKGPPPKYRYLLKHRNFKTLI